MVGLPASTDGRYQRLIAALHARELFGVKLGLGRTRRLLAALGNPEDRFPALLVAGTNGKGSTCAMLSAILRERGFRTGLFTSPHLHDYRERIRVDGYAISPDELVALGEPMLPLFQEVGATYFEAATALAFEHFARRDVEAAVVEVGLGGRLDSTNVLPRPLAVVTDVDRDHVERLGRTIPLIAREKAGIIHTGCRAVSGCRRPAARRVLRETARRRRAKLRELDACAEWRVATSSARGIHVRLRTAARDYGVLRVPLLGAHQARNAALAVLAAESFCESRGGIEPEVVRRGLLATRWPGRLETIDREPLTMVDVAHNPSGAAVLADTVREVLPGRRCVIVFGCLANKDHRGMLRALAPAAEAFILVDRFGHRPAAPIATLRRALRALGREAEPAANAEEALRRARRLAGRRGLVLVCGSSYLVTEALAARGRGVVERI